MPTPSDLCDAVIEVVVSPTPINVVSSVVSGIDVLVNQAGVQGPQGAQGAFGSGDTSRIVYTTGDQEISGKKTFHDQIYTMGSVVIDGSGYLDFATTTPVWQEGRVFYDSGTHALCYYNNAADVTVNLGQEQLLPARNAEADTLLNGTIVFLSGAQGNKPHIYRATNLQASGVSDRTIGVVTHNIAHNQVGYVTTFGIVHDVDTENFAEGDRLYLGTGGFFVSVRPSPPNHVVEIGQVNYSHKNQGEIFVNIHKVSCLSELHDVSLSGLQSGDGLFWDSSRFVWRNRSPSSISGASTEWVDQNYYPRTNPSGFEPAHFGVDFSIVRSGDFIKEVQYADATKTELFYSGTKITGISYGTYTKRILYQGELITGVEYV